MVKVKKERSELEQNLIDVILEIKNDKKIVKQIKDGLKPQKILAGEVQKWFQNPEKHIKEMDDEKLYFLTEQIYLITGSALVDHREFFTPREVKEIKTTFEGYKSNEINFPYTFRNATKLSDGWSVHISVTELRLLNNGREIQYNPNVQRSSKVIKSDEGNAIPVPKIYKSKLAEIKDLFLRGKLRTTTLTFNARLGSSDEDEEVLFDEETGNLTITKGTLFDCIDGFHRLTATTQAQESNTDVDMLFMVKISNTTEAGAKEEFTQINKVTAVHKAQRDRMDQERFENFIVEKFLRGEESEIKNKIVSENTVNYKSNNLVSYSVLSDAISDQFKISNKSEAIKIGRFLSEFINEICYAYPDEFLGEDIAEIKEKSLINSNVMFAGYIALSKRFYEQNISVDKVGEVLLKINFNRDNPEWKELNIVDNKGSLLNSSKKGLVKYFEELNI